VRRFEADLKSSPELQAELGLYKEIDEALADTEVLSFRDQLSDLRKDKRKVDRTIKNPFRFSKPWHYAATAAIALLLALGLAAMLSQPVTNNDLLRKYYKPYEVALMNRSANGEIYVSLTKGKTYYDLGDFKNALVYFEQVQEEYPDMVESNFYAGISYYELEKYGKAEGSLNKVILQNDNLYIDQAEWYLGLCYIAVNDNDRARRQFARIASSNSDKARAAKKVLRQLRNK
jgi:tetratricopeptide (TPR) repeat protein